MAKEDYWAKAKDLAGWRKASSELGLNRDKPLSQKQFRDLKQKINAKSDEEKAAEQAKIEAMPVLKTIGEGDDKVTYVEVPGDAAATMSASVDAAARANDRLDMIFLANQATILKQKDNEIRETESNNQLAGEGLRSDATRYQAEQSAGADRFAATEGARATIESQRIQSQSLERQIGLKGAQDRLLAIEQGAQERLNIGATGEEQRRTQAQLLASQEKQIGLTGIQQRLTQAQLLAGQERQIGLTGEQQRLTAAETGRQERLGIAATGTEQRRTQAQLLAGQERQIGLTGTQQRLTEETRGAQERLGIAATGTEQRATQAQLLAGQERQIEMTGAQQRMLAQEQGRQQRETEMQAEMNRRYKEAKDAAQAARAFRA